MSNTRELDAEWMETDCPGCGHTYLWHIDERNQCTHCRADYGRPVNLSDLSKKLRK